MINEIRYSKIDGARTIFIFRKYSFRRRTQHVKIFFPGKIHQRTIERICPVLESLSSVGCFVPSKLVPKSELSIPPPMAPPATYPVFLRNLRRDKSVSSLSLVLFSSSDNVIPPHHSVV